jgi:predicted O-methyltransferase YrrM
MYSPTQLAFKYLGYWISASNGKGHGIHSPFVFDFVTKVLNGPKNGKLYAEIEAIRKRMLNSTSVITVEDFGAGSRVIGTRQRSVRQIANTSLKPKKYSQLFHRMVEYYQPKTILEIGTSLGITTAYMAKASPETIVVTMEGAAEVLAIAMENFISVHARNISPVLGNFDETLPAFLMEAGNIDLAFIDGNHRYEPTISYFQQIIKKSNDYTLIILDDIYWSKEMEQAWQWVKEHERVRLTIDLFAIGIAVLRPEILHKQHFRIRY